MEVLCNKKKLKMYREREMTELICDCRKNVSYLKLLSGWAVFLLVDANVLRYLMLLDKHLRSNLLFEPVI